MNLKFKTCKLKLSIKKIQNKKKPGNERFRKSNRNFRV